MTSLLHVRPHTSKLSPIGRIQARSISLWLGGKKAAKKNKRRSFSPLSASVYARSSLSQKLSARLSVLGIAGTLGPEYVLDKRFPGAEVLRSRRPAALVKHLEPESTKKPLTSIVEPLVYPLNTPANTLRQAGPSRLVDFLNSISRQTEQKKMVGNGRRMKKHAVVHVRRRDSVLPSDSDKPVKVSGPLFLA